MQHKYLSIIVHLALEIIYINAQRCVLLDSASVNRCDYLGRSALHHAAGNGHVGCVVFLVAFGANIWALDNDFNTPLDAAASHNRMAVVRRLEAAAADQMYSSIKTVKKQRATAIRDAEKRARRFLRKSRHETETDRLDSGRAFRGYTDPDGEEGRPGNSPSYVSLTLSSSLSGRSALSDLRPSSNERNFPSCSTYFGIGAAPLTANSSSSSSRSIGQPNGATNGSKNGSLLGALARKLQRKPRYLSTFASEPALNCGEQESPTVHKINGYTAAVKSTSRLYAHRTNLDIKGEISKPNGHHQQSRRPLTPFHVGQSAEIVVQHADESLEIEDIGSSPTDRQFWIQRNARGGLAVQVSDDPSTGSRDAKRLDPASKSVDQTSVPDTNPSAVIVTADHQNSGTFRESSRNTNAARCFPERIESGLEAFLRAHGLLEYITVLTREKLDMNSLVLVDDLDLKELGIPLGPRRILLDAIAKRRTMLSNAGRISDKRF